VHSPRARRGTAALAAAAAIGGLVVASVGTAVAASSPVTVTIGTTSAFKPVSGDTFVRFLGPNITPDAVISGTVTGIPAQTTAAVTLLSKPFGASAFSAGRPVTLTLAGGAGSYSFSVAPAVATTYEVQVTEAAAASPSPSPSASSSSSSAAPDPSKPASTSPSPSASPSKSASPSPSPSSSAPTIGSGPVLVATSAARTVYVIADRAITGSVACAKPARPVCHVNVSYTFRVPVSAIKTEMAKHLFLYSRVLLSKTGEPPAPKLLVLNTTASRGKVRKLTIRKFAVPAHYSVRVGSESFHYLISGCLQDTESKDGIGLPGRHGCGATSIPAAQPYIG
jgi:hypothetical protein